MRKAFNLILVILVLSIVFGCSKDDADVSLQAPPLVQEEDSFLKRTIVEPPMIDCTQEYDVDIYASRHNQIVNAGVAEGYTYQEFWEDMPTIAQDIIDDNYVNSGVSGADVALAVAEELGGPYFGNDMTNTELAAAVKATWEDTELQGELTEAVRTQMISIIDYAAVGGNPIPQLEALRISVDQSGTELEKAWVGTALGSAYLWYDPAKGPVNDYVAGFMIDNVVGALGWTTGPAGLFFRGLGALSSLQFAIYCEDPDAPEFTWGGVGHWGLHHKDKTE